MNDRIEKIQGFYARQGRMPSYAEMAKLLGYKTKSAAYALVSKLVDEGFVVRDRTGKLLPGESLTSIRRLGTVAAGFPSAAEEDRSDMMTLDEWIIDNREATYMLSVSGDSMKDAGIIEGDTVIVEKNKKPKPGQIVIADVDGEWTMKYLRRDRGGDMYLQAANDRYPDIRPSQSLNIAAVVTAVVRKY